MRGARCKNGAAQSGAVGQAGAAGAAQGGAPACRERRCPHRPRSKGGQGSNKDNGVWARMVAPPVGWGRQLARQPPWGGGGGIRQKERGGAPQSVGVRMEVLQWFGTVRSGGPSSSVDKT